MRIVMMGTGPFAVPTLAAVLAAGHEVPLVVTRPLGPVRGKTDAEVNPTRALAEARGLPLFAPDSINTPDAIDRLRAALPELLIVCDYGQILSPAVLAIATHGGINLHGSLLPKYRGAAPVAWAIFHGEAETGVTVIHMTPKIDAGPAILQGVLPIRADDTCATLEPRLADLGAPLVVQAIEQLAAGTTRPIAQDASLVSKAPRLKKTDGLIDWTRGAAEIECQIRAMQPWPKAYAFVRRGSEPPLRLIVERAAVVPPGERDAAGDALPGTTLRADKDRWTVATGVGELQLLLVQPAGKRAMSSADFLRGYPVKRGDALGGE